MPANLLIFITESDCDVENGQKTLLKITHAAEKQWNCGRGYVIL